MTTSVLISGSYFPPQVGGISHLLATICATLGPKAVSVLTGVPDDDVADPRVAGLKVYRRPWAFNQGNVSHPVLIAAAMAEVLVRERPAVLQFASCDQAHIAWWTYRTVHLPYIVYAYGNEILAAIRSNWKKPRQVLIDASRIIAISRYTANLVANAGVDPRRVEIVHPGCDIDRFQPLELGEKMRRALLGERWNDRVILTVGNLVERKGHDIAMKAFRHAMKRVPNICYVIAGDGPHRKVLQAMAGELGIAHRVIFAGRVTEERLPLYYALCEVFLMPSRARIEQDDVEGFGIVFLEAGACGKPCIGGRSGGVEDAILENHTGLLVEPNEEHQLASAIESLLLNPDLAKRMGEQARKHVVDEHSWRRIGARIGDVIASIADKK